MRRALIVLFAAGLLAGCHDAGNSAGNTSDGGSAIANAADDAGDAIGNAADDAADTLGNGIEDMGNAIVGPVKPGQYDDWVGRWIGVEGTYVDIEKVQGTSDKYRLTMQYDLDHKGTFIGQSTAGGIEFIRPDGTQLLQAGDGKATGLKYLAGKKDCLIVNPGEGYCRS